MDLFAERKSAFVSSIERESENEAPFFLRIICLALESYKFRFQVISQSDDLLKVVIFGTPFMEEGLNGVLADENKLITSADSCRLTVLPITRENMAITIHQGNSVICRLSYQSKAVCPHSESITGEFMQWWSWAMFVIVNCVHLALGEKRLFGMPSLPDETIMRILALLSWRDLIKISMTCRRLHRLTQDSTLWTKFSVKGTEGKRISSANDLRTKLTWDELERV